MKRIEQIKKFFKLWKLNMKIESKKKKELEIDEKEYVKEYYDELHDCHYVQYYNEDSIYMEKKLNLYTKHYITMSMINEIYDFIKNTFTLEHYENIKNLSGYEDAFGGNYKIFLSHNKICLDELNTEDLQFTYLLYKKIKNNKIKTLFTKNEDYDINEAFTFYFDINDKLIIY